MTKEERQKQFKRLSSETIEWMADNHPIGLDGKGRRRTVGQTYQKLYHTIVMQGNEHLLHDAQANHAILAVKQVIADGHLKKILGLVLGAGFGVPVQFLDRITTLSSLIDMIDTLGLKFNILDTPNGYVITIKDEESSRPLLHMQDVSNIKVMVNAITDTVKEWMSRKTALASKVL